MMQFVSGFGIYVVPFLVILTVLVFVHEFGHFIVARRNGVKVEVFSVGFGPELFGRTDRHGTRWRISLLPLGGYVRMMGDGDVASVTQVPVPLENRQGSLFAKTVGQRAAISFAGPAANFLFAIVVLAILFATAGRPFTPPTADQVTEDGAAAAAGIQAGDRFLTVNGQPVARFEELQRIVQESAGKELAVEVRREEQVLALSVTPKASETTDRFGNTRTVGLLGVRSLQMETARQSADRGVERRGRDRQPDGRHAEGPGPDHHRIAWLRGAGRAAAHRPDVGAGGAGRADRHAVVHGGTVDQSRPDQSVPRSGSGRRAARLLCSGGRARASARREGAGGGRHGGAGDGACADGIRDLERSGSSEGRRLHRPAFHLRIGNRLCFRPGS
jgi:membrane-associated protease RseP (regulator of RpoE activity)